MALIRETDGTYRTRRAVRASEQDILAAAEEILRLRTERLGSLTTPSSSREFLRMRLAALPHEEFHAVWLDQRHRILGVEKLFIGTVAGASVHPREVVRAALTWNAAGVVFAHNHPSGSPQESQADRDITHELKRALALVDVRVLDHVVVGAEGTVSLAERGLL